MSSSSILLGAAGRPKGPSRAVQWRDPTPTLAGMPGTSPPKPLEQVQQQDNRSSPGPAQSKGIESLGPTQQSTFWPVFQITPLRTPVGEPLAWSTLVRLLNPVGTAQGSSIGLREQLLENFYPDTGVPRPLSVALKVPQEEKKRRCGKFHVHQHEKVIR